MLLTAAMLRVVEEAGEGVLVLCDGLVEDELAGSRLTRQEVQRQLMAIARALDALPPAAREAMPEIDWAGWMQCARALQGGGPDALSALWFGVRSLVPATLSWLRVYRREQPALFSYTA